MSIETRPSRSRTGCLTCRKRHLKCNEQQPKCSRCVASKRPCQYPLTEATTPDLDHDLFEFPPAQRWIQLPRKLRFISEVFITPEQRPERGFEPRHHHRRRRRPSPMKTEWNETVTSSRSLPPPTSPSSDRDEGDMVFSGQEASLSRTRLDSSPGSSSEKELFRSVYTPGPYKPIEDPLISHLLQYYMHDIAPWLDLTDPLCHFARRVPHMAIRCPMLLYAILALASSRIVRVEKHNELGLDSLASIRYYDACMGYLIRALEVPEIVSDEVIPVTTVILYTYEIFEGHRDSQNHLKGTLSVFAHQRRRLGRPGIRRTTFWTYIRQEIIVALQTRRPTNIDLESWQGDMYWGEDSDDAWANRMSWLLVKVINFYFREDNNKEIADEAADFLHDEVNNWRAQTPLTLGPLCTLETGVCDDEPFPVISYTFLWHFIGMQFYHLACILLDLKCSTGNVDEMLSHAHQICGAAITLGKRSPGAMINSIGPLIVCGQVVTKPSERMRLLNLLTEIGAVTGWPVSKETAGLLHTWSAA